MWNKESRRAARQAYKENRWAARQAYRAARHQYRASRRFYQRRSGRVGIVFLFIVLCTFVFSGSFHMATIFTLVLPVALLGFLIAMIVNRAMRAQNFYQSYDPSAQQPYGGTAQPHYQGPQAPPQPEPSPESYQAYEQGYQVAEREQEPVPEESYSQEEQPQALYPQSLPPMEQ